MNVLCAVLGYEYPQLYMCCSSYRLALWLLGRAIYQDSSVPGLSYCYCSRSWDFCYGFNVKYLLQACLITRSTVNDTLWEGCGIQNVVEPYWKKQGTGAFPEVSQFDHHSLFFFFLMQCNQLAFCFSLLAFPMMHPIQW